MRILGRIQLGGKMEKYVILNCPCLIFDDECRANSLISYLKCKDCTDCFIKQVAEGKAELIKSTENCEVTDD